MQYKWWTYDGAWKPVGGWTSSNTFAWTPSTTFPAGRITVWAKGAANTADEAEASAAMDFVIFGHDRRRRQPRPRLPPRRVTTVASQPTRSLRNRRAPPLPSPPRHRAAPAPLQYKWWIYDGAWKPVGGWTTSSTFAWTPATTYPGGRVTVWAKSATNTADEAEASTAMDFVISGTAVTPPPPSAVRPPLPLASPR